MRLIIHRINKGKSYKTENYVKLNYYYLYKHIYIVIVSYIKNFPQYFKI